MVLSSDLEIFVDCNAQNVRSPMFEFSKICGSAPYFFTVRSHNVEKVVVTIGDNVAFKRTGLYSEIKLFQMTWSS